MTLSVIIPVFNAAEYLENAVKSLFCCGKRPDELNADELIKISRFACAVAGLSTERSGGISSIPQIEELQKKAYFIC